MSKMKLSICVITMNRAKQLQEALASCLACQLPQSTEFVIIDNASTDETEQTVRAVLDNCGYPYYYEKLSQNLGVGGGRNYAYSKAQGEYVYMLDDDAVIANQENDTFFVRATDAMDEYPEIVTLTTQIYDTAWEKNRIEKNGPSFAPNLYKTKMFCGGSHFLRKSFYSAPPYLPNKYGYEEIPPSLRAINAKKINAFSPELLIIHKPAMNKWDRNDPRNHQLIIKDVAIPYAIKRSMYPTIAMPLLRLAKAKRTKIHLSEVPNAKKQVKEAVVAFQKEYPICEKIKLSTLFRLIREFKLSVF